MKVGRAVVDRLVANGIDAVFGIPGKQTLPLNEAIGEREDVRFVMARHETAVTHQAWGYAETSGRPAATVVVPGPGDMNAMNGLKNALNDCTPLIHIAVETEPAIRGGEGIHETPPATYDTVVKENVLVERPEGTITTLQAAIAAAVTPPMGPVRVGIPKDFLKRDVALASPPTYPTTGIEDVADADVETAADVLAAADEPVILAGGGVRCADGVDLGSDSDGPAPVDLGPDVAGTNDSDEHGPGGEAHDRASTALERIAKRLDAPVVTTYKGKGVIPDDHELSAGTLSGSAPPALLDCLASADALLAVGTDFDALATRAWSVDVPDALVHVTLDPNDLGTGGLGVSDPAVGYEPTVSVVADAGVAMAAIEETLADRGLGPSSDCEVNGRRGTGVDRARTVRSDFDDRVANLRGTDPPLSSVDALEAVREGVPREAIVAVDAGGFRVWGLNAFDADGPRSYVNPGSWASMGTGLPSGIGAQLANPDRDVVVLTGDGGLMMCVHELHAAVAEALSLTVVVFANDDYAIISEDASRNYALEPGAYGWPDAPIDFVALAESLGMRGERAASVTDVQSTVSAAVGADEPVLVQVPTDPHEPQASEWLSEKSTHSQE